jgi:hypothetical protein
VTGWQITGLAVAFWITALLVGTVLHLLLAQSTYRRGVLDGQRQAELVHGLPPTLVDVRRPGHDRWALLDRPPSGSLPRPVMHD